MKDLRKRWNVQFLMMVTVSWLMGFLGVLHAEKVAIIDAGSSGSRLYVYEIDRHSSEKVKLLFPQNKTEKKTSKGRPLSSVVCHPDSVRVFLENMTQHFVSDSIQLYVIATAGMRLQSKAHADSLYRYIKQTSALDGYRVRDALTLSGQYEGLYAWLAANYINRKIAFESVFPLRLTYCDEPFGILEIGGASMQLAFPMKEAQEYSLYREGLGHLYTRSYLGAGVNEIFKNTKMGRRYRFRYEYDESVSDWYGPNTLFWGLGGSVEKVLEGIEEQGRKDSFKGKFKAYRRALKYQIDTATNYHNRMNAHYTKWVLDRLDLSDRFTQPEEKSSWTLGAVLDLVVFKKTPESFDYQHPN